MLTLVKFTAEHIGRTRGTALVRDLESKDFCVSAARMDPVFETNSLLLSTATRAKMLKYGTLFGQ